MNETPIGVGPHPKPWPTDKKYDLQLLENGDRRNVLDRFRYLTVEAIKAELDTTRIGLQVAIENWQHDLNIGTIVRTANAFNVSVVHVIGRRHWNRRGAMVTDRYLNIEHHATVEDFVARMAQLNKTIIAVDNLPGALNLSDTTLPTDCVLVFGGEGPGLSQSMVAAAKMMVKIEQFGSTRSVNVGVASGIVIYGWLQQHVLSS
ncbi:MAG: TrmH family RNA methyltransferase [Candidatus Saccharibacteria bacterium]